jgi:hypothetical protein
MSQPTVGGPDSTIAPEHYYAIVRGQIEHEDNLIGQRLSWYVAAQSFLFTAYAIVVSNSGPNHTPLIIERMRLLLWLIPMTSILTCLLIYLTIVAGALAIRDLRRLYRKHADYEATVGLPPVQGYRRTQMLGQAAPLFVPLVFLVVWVMLLARGANF